MKLSTIEKWMGNHPKLVFKKGISKRVENSRSLPLFVDVFSSMITSGYPPKQSVFAAKFLELPKTKAFTNGDKDFEAYVEARARRVYPSLIREYHFYVKLKNEFACVFRNSQLDVGKGIDFVVVTEEGLSCGIGLTLATYRAQAFLAEKMKERHNVKIPMMYFTPDDEVGAFWTHSDKQIEEIKLYLEKLKVEIKEND